jgi:hypothetical protein
MTDPIRAALDKAAEATCPTARTSHGSCAPLCIYCPRVAANAIAAFFRALHANGLTAIADGNLPWLADYVLAAAKDQSQ